jgi:hypothetical protein
VAIGQVNIHPLPSVFWPGFTLQDEEGEKNNFRHGRNNLLAHMHKTGVRAQTCGSVNRLVSMHEHKPDLPNLYT